MTHVPPHVPRHVPARTNEGWGAIGLVLALAAACIVTVTIIHKRTYKHPTDPTFVSSGDRDISKGAAH